MNNTTINPNTILLATDGSKDAMLAAKVATDLSKRTGAQLHVAHAWRHRFRSFGYPTVAWTDYSYLDERQARRLLGTQIDSIEAPGGISVESHLLQGPPIDAILDLCEELRPGLVVMGSRGLGPVGRLFVGSVSEGVVHHASCPVLVARGGDGAWPPERIVAGDDGSESAELAAKMATGIGSLLGAEGVLVRAHQNPPERIGGWSAEDRRRLDEARSREEQELNRRAQTLAQYVGSRPETRVVDADATLALLLVAEEGDERKTMIAVGSRGLGVLGRARLGSVSTNVLRAASGPVLIYSKPKQEIPVGASQEATLSRAAPASPEQATP
jgi:nucleotide-binding universal stress UspA family protein